MFFVKLAEFESHPDCSKAYPSSQPQYELPVALAIPYEVPASTSSMYATASTSLYAVPGANATQHNVSLYETPRVDADTET